MDLKSLLLGSALGLAAGGGLSGLYVKTYGMASLSEVEAYGLLAECMSLNHPSVVADKSKEASLLLEKIKAKMPDISKADAVLTATAIAAKVGSQVPSGFGGLLSKCSSDIDLALKINASKNAKN